jgi:hypothetical protein
MKSSRKFLALTCLTIPLLLTNCFKSGAILATGLSPYTLTLSPRPTSIPVGTAVTFTANVSGGTDSPSWDRPGYAYGNLGTPTVQAGVPAR